jgi:ribosomal protein S18 acetylase RimI-like enzyme
MPLNVELLKEKGIKTIEKKLSVGQLEGDSSLISQIKDSYSNESKYSIAAKRLEDDEIIGVAIFERLKWDTEHFGINIGRINEIIAWEEEYRKEEAVKEEMLRFIENKCEKDKIACVYCRVGINDFSSIHSLESNGFRLIDVLTTFYFDFRRNKIFQKLSYKKDSLLNEITTRAWKEKDLDELASIAGMSYIYDRFHSDPMFPKDKSDELHRKWIVNCCNGLTDEVLVAASDNKPLGFITCKVKGAKGVIDMVGVAKDMQKRGVGAMLVNAAREWFKNRVDVVEVGTQNRNIPAMKLYMNAGFMPVSSKLTFHRWFS